MEIIFMFLVLMLSSMLVGFYARSKGRSGFGYFVLSFLLSPLLVFFLVLILPDIGQERRQLREIAQGKSRRCVCCAEVIKAEALICKHCGKEQPLVEAQPALKINYNQHNPF